MSNSNLPFGIDISRWNYSQDGKQKMDFDQVKVHKPEVMFVAIRAGISWGYTDPWFAYGWENAKRVSIARVAYHVPYFGENVVRQVDHFFNIVEPESNWYHDRLVLDNEVQHQNSRQRITDVTNQMLEICRSRTGMYPIIYSRANWVDSYMIVSELPQGIQWWLAQYLWARPAPLYTPEHPGPPTLPRGVGNWRIHQTAERTPSIGTTAMRYMDYNRWNGTVEDVLKYFNMDKPVDPDPDPEPLTLEERVADNTRRIEALEAK